MAGLVIVLLVFGLAVAIGRAQEAFVAKLRAEATHVKRWGGAILLVVGAWTIAIGVWASYFSRFFPV